MAEERKMPEAREPDTGGNPYPAGSPARPAWRAWLVSILVAIVLSVAATLLLGGDLPFETGGSPPGGCGSGAACCPGADPGPRGGK